MNAAKNDDRRLCFRGPVGEEQGVSRMIRQILDIPDFSLGSPEDPNVRGSHVSLRHAEAFRICSAMKNPPEGETKVIPDFREPDNIRLGLSPLYNTFGEVYTAVHRISRIVEAGEFMGHSDRRGEVT